MYLVVAGMIMRQLKHVSSSTIDITQRVYPQTAWLTKRSLRTQLDQPTVLMEESRLECAEYSATISHLNKLQVAHPLRKKKSSSARQRTEEWLQLLGIDLADIRKPQVIHIAGTKGKGTTCYYCNGILNEYYKASNKATKVGCYTSPHQVEVRERIQINSEPIAKAIFTKYYWLLWNKVESLTNCTHIETPSVPGYPGFLALLAIYIFIKEEVDVAVIETGIGGERDSTNVFRSPVVTGITTIDFDHVGTLGNSIEEISRHKAGILKKGCLAFTVPQSEAVLDVLRKRAQEVHIYGELEVVSDSAVKDYGISVRPNTNYQISNASLAISLANAYLRSTDPDFVMTPSLARSVEKIQLPGRCEIKADEGNTWFLSVAHNHVSIKQTILWFKETVLQQNNREPGVLIFSHQWGRDANSILQLVYTCFKEGKPMPLKGVIFCSDRSDEAGNEIPDLVDFRRDMKSPEIQQGYAETWKRLGGYPDAVVVHTVKQAIQSARQNYPRTNVLVTGNHYLVGSTLYFLNRVVPS